MRLIEKECPNCGVLFEEKKQLDSHVGRFLKEIMDLNANIKK